MWGEDLERRVPRRLLARMREIEVFAEVEDPQELTIFLLNHEPFPISGTSIRGRQSRGLPIRELVPHEVHSYIEKYGLYASGGGTEA
jgi:nicotinic acid mononucleotide adenylyltransferase